VRKLNLVNIKKVIERTGLTKKEIEKKVKETQKEFKGLLSEDGALFVMLKELGIKEEQEKEGEMKYDYVSVSDIVFDLKNINIIGRIKHIDRVYSFNRNDGSIGHVRSFILRDDTGDIKVVLWNEQVNIVENENFVVNTLVRLKDVYVKQDKYQKNEIHSLGKSYEIDFFPKDVNYRKFPKIKEEKILLKDVSLECQSISVEGKIMQKLLKKEFVKKTGEKGKLLAIILVDSTTSMKVNFWDGLVDQAEILQENDVLLVTDLSSKFNSYSNTIELNSSMNSKITKITKSIEVNSMIMKINELKTGISSCKGVVTHNLEKKDIELKSGEKSRNYSVVISDDTGTINLNLWNNDIEKYEKLLEKGNSVILKNVLVKYNHFFEKNEITMVEDSLIEVVDNLQIENLVEYDFFQVNDSKYSFSEIQLIDKPDRYSIKGFIVKSFNKITIYESCSKCFKKVENCNCKEKHSSEIRMILNLIVDDETSTIKTVFVGEIAEQLIGQQVDKLQRIQETKDFELFVNSKSDELLGEDIVLYGKAKYSTFSKAFELYIHKFEFMDIQEQIKELVKRIES